MGKRQGESAAANGEQRLREAAQALADAAGQFGQTLGGAGSQAESGVTKGLLAAAQALAQASAWVEQRSRPLGTRERLLAQAMRLFGEHGYAGVSLEDIAQAAGFTKGAVYSHFGSKEQTFLAALRAATESLGEVGRDAGPDAAGGEGGAGGSGGSGSGGGAGAPDTAGTASAGAAGVDGLGDAGLAAAAQQALLAEHRVAISGAVTLAIEAMLFGQRVPERRDEVREIVSDLVAALAAADRRLAALAGAPERELDRDEARVAELALRTLLLGLAEERE